MTVDEASVRNDWTAFCAVTSERYTDMKDSPGALLAIAARYEALTGAEKIVVDRLLVEQLTPTDPQFANEGGRFEALSLVDRFAVTSALPALRDLASWLEEQATPGAPYEWAKVNRIIGRLATAGR